MKAPRRRRRAPFDDPIPPTPKARRLADGRIRYDYAVQLEAGEVGPRRTALLVVRTHPGTGASSVTLVERSA